MQIVANIFSKERCHYMTRDYASVSVEITLPADALR